MYNMYKYLYRRQVVDVWWSCHPDVWLRYQFQPLIAPPGLTGHGMTQSHHRVPLQNGQCHCTLHRASARRARSLSPSMSWQRADPQGLVTPLRIRPDVALLALSPANQFQLVPQVLPALLLLFSLHQTLLRTLLQSAGPLSVTLLLVRLPCVCMHMHMPAQQLLAPCTTHMSQHPKLPVEV